MTRFCQDAKIAVLLGAFSAALGTAGEAGAQPVGPAVETARRFFDALDRGDIPQASKVASAGIAQNLPDTINRRQQFGGRLRGDTGPRQVVSNVQSGGSTIVTFHARYQRAMLEQVAFVVCARACQVTAFREGTAYLKAF